ncbi:hypothetical protein N787_09380 [Arenimonas metalli CF5-1]|uniref:RDD domain-containing protein n=2 Tax=Arenimonas TaxID=490567 RepID=A0A091B5B3_9GAMM|nr:hypothetical protein N787_09380 [Arenimonas metalli CF5-1]
MESSMQETELEYVGFWPRVGATIIDAIILTVITAPPLIAIYGPGYFTDANRPFISGLADFAISWVFPAVAVILFWLYKQATPGKMALSARVVDATTGNTLTVGQSIVRYVAYFIASLPLFIGVIWVAFDPRKQGWHDKLAGTVVVRPKQHGPYPVKFDN